MKSIDGKTVLLFSSIRVLKIYIEKKRSGCNAQCVHESHLVVGVWGLRGLAADAFEFGRYPRYQAASPHQRVELTVRVISSHFICRCDVRRYRCCKKCLSTLRVSCESLSWNVCACVLSPPSLRSLRGQRME